MAADVIGWGVWVTKPGYMVDCESFWKCDGDTIEDVFLYAETLSDIYKYWINVTEYIEIETDSNIQDFVEREIHWRKRT